MEVYYGIMFLVAALLQESSEGFLPSLWIGITTYFGEGAVYILSQVGFSFLSGVILFELLVLLPCILYYQTKLGKVIIWVLLLSITFNTILIVIPLDWYHLVIPYYKYISILMIESMLITSFSQSKLKPFLKEKLKRRK